MPKAALNCPRHGFRASSFARTAIMLPSSITPCKRPLSDVDERDRKKIKSKGDVSSDYIMALLTGNESGNGHGSWPSTLQQTQIPDNRTPVSASIQIKISGCQINDIAGNYNHNTYQRPDDRKHKLQVVMLRVLTRISMLNRPLR
jgi:hypothetical protein